MVLLVAPWSAFWFRNVFAQYGPIGDLLSNPFVRGTVSGIGLITATDGLAELAGAFSRGRRADPEPPAR